MIAETKVLGAYLKHERINARIVGARGARIACRSGIVFPNEILGLVFSSGLASVGEGELDVVTIDVVELAEAGGDDGVARGVWRRRSADAGIKQANGVGEGCEVEVLAAAPVDFEVVRHAEIAMELKAVSDPRASRQYRVRGAQGKVA